MLEELLAQLKEQQANNPETGTEAALELNWESLDAASQNLAALISLFALAPIPLSLLEAAANASSLEMDIAVVCTALVERYLLQQMGEETYQLHERVRDWLRGKLEKSAKAEDLQRGFCQAMAAIAGDIPQALTQEAVAKFTPAIPHLVEAATAQQQWLADEDLIWPFVGLGRFYEGQGAYQQALPWYENSLSATRERLGKSHPAVASSLNNLAELYESQGRYAEAEPLYQQALVIAEKVLGENHPTTVKIRKNLQMMRQQQHPSSKL